MSEFDLPAGVQMLINRHLASFDHVEVLMQLRGAEQDGCTVEGLAATMHVAPLTVRSCLTDLEASGFVRQDDADGRFRYAYPTEADRTTLDLLAQTYRQRPVTLVRAIYARPVRNVDRLGNVAQQTLPEDE